MPDLCRVDQSSQICTVQGPARGQETGSQEEEADTLVHEDIDQWVTDGTRLVVLMVYFVFQLNKLALDQQHYSLPLRRSRERKRRGVKGHDGHTGMIYSRGGMRHQCRSFVQMDTERD